MFLKYVRKNHEQSFSGLEWSSHLYKKKQNLIGLLINYSDGVRT